MHRILLSILSAVFVSQAAAFQCQPMHKVMSETSIIFIGSPQQIIQRKAEIMKEPGIDGIPYSYDLVRFSVIEPLKGDIPRTIDLLCPTSDMRCRVTNEYGPLIIALRFPLVANTPQHLFCNMEYLAPPPGWGNPDRDTQEMVEKLRVVRKRK
jgi:hypothetical protein